MPSKRGNSRARQCLTLLRDVLRPDTYQFQKPAGTPVVAGVPVFRVPDFFLKGEFCP